LAWGPDLKTAMKAGVVIPLRSLSAAKANAESQQ
jgi:hypothetical protein